jgi:hypothetical protein
MWSEEVEVAETCYPTLKSLRGVRIGHTAVPKSLREVVLMQRDR